MNAEYKQLYFQDGWVGAHSISVQCERWATADLTHRILAWEVRGTGGVVDEGVMLLDTKTAYDHNAIRFAIQRFDELEEYYNAQGA